jgi:predicted DNA-binding transcriptional regulator YafY
VAPVQFSEKQANALITAQHIINQSKDASFVNDFNDALTKIKSVFRSSIQEKSELLSNKIHVFNWTYEEFSSDALSEIQLAITHFNCIEIKYQKASDPSISFRRIEPCALYSANHKWVLIAWCHLRKEMRAFRIDRILQFKILPEQFTDRKFNLQEYFASCPYDS